MRLYLVRHPVAAVAPGICYGRTDLPLAAGWEEAAQRLAERLPVGLPVCSSPLQRCHLFAGALSGNVTADPRLVELDFGRWEMQDWNGIPRTELDAWAADPLGYAGHGGESVAAMRARVHDALAEVDGDQIWVTHAGVMKLVFASMHKLEPGEWLGLRFEYAAMTCLEWS